MSGDFPFPDRNSWHKLVRHIARATRRSEAAEDLLHSAFVRLEEYRKRAPVDNPGAFLARTAVNISIDQGRRKIVQSEISLDVHDLISLRDTNALQDEVLIVRKRLMRVQEGLNQLSPRTREIFLMHRLEGLKYREIATHLGVTVSAVEKHIAKAALFLAQWSEGW